METPVYVVGTLVEGGRVLSHESVTPQEGVEVWLESDPESKMTFDQADSGLDIEWEMEPYPADGSPKAAAVGMEDDTLSDPTDPFALLDKAEERIATIEGMVADVMLADLQDEAFLGEPEDEDPDYDATTDAEDTEDKDLDEESPAVKMRRAKKAQRAAMAAEKGSVVEGLAGMLERAVVAAAIAAEEAAGDVVEEPVKEGAPDEVQSRIESLMDRISKLEESVAQLLDTQLDDAELLPDEDDETTITEGDEDDAEPED